jgi:hypothetical protein
MERRVQTYTAHITGPRGASLRIDILADDLTHARELAREHGLASFGRHGFSFTVWAA